MTDMKTALETARGMLERGELADVAAVNVLVVRMMGVLIVRGSMPKAVRDAYRAAVKAGSLGYLPKDGMRPAAFFHPNSRWEAMDQRDREARQAVAAIAGVMVVGSEEFGFRDHLAEHREG